MKIRLLLILSLAFSCNTFAKITHPQDSSQVSKQLRSVEQSIKSIETQVIKTRKNLSEHEKNIAQMDLELQKKLQEKKKMEGSIQSLTSELRELEQALSNLKTEEDTHFKILGSYLKAQQKQNHSSDRFHFLHDQSFNETLKATTFRKKLANAQGLLLQETQMNIQTTQSLQSKVQEKQLELSDLNKSLDTERLALEKQRKENLKSSQNYQKQLTLNLSKQKTLSQQHDELGKLLTKLETVVSKAKVAKIFQSASTFETLTGKLPSPLGANRSTVQPYPQKKGAVFMPAPEGSEVVAIGAGRVIFAEWLKGVGLLMIVDHGQGYMSLYGNNELLYKATGETVKAGERIASVGRSGGQLDAGLYFEIRKNGHSLDPKRWITLT